MSSVIPNPTPNAAFQAELSQGVQKFNIPDISVDGQGIHSPQSAKIKSVTDEIFLELEQLELDGENEISNTTTKLDTTESKNPTLRTANKVNNTINGIVDDTENDTILKSKIDDLKAKEKEIESKIVDLEDDISLSKEEVADLKQDLQEELSSIQTEIKALTRELKGKDKVDSKQPDTSHTSVELESLSDTSIELEDINSTAKIDDPIKLDSKESSMQGILSHALDLLKNRPGIDKDSIEIKSDFKKNEQGKYQVDRFKSPHIQDENLCSFECSFEITFKDETGKTHTIKADPPQTVYTSTSDPAKGIEVAMKFANLASQMALVNQDLNGHVEGLNDDNKKAMMSQSSFVFSPDSTGRMNNIKTESGFELKPADRGNTVLFDVNTRKYTKGEKGVTAGPHQKIYNETEFARKNYAEGTDYLQSISEDRKRREEYLEQKLSHIKTIVADFKQAKGDLTPDKISIQKNIKQFISNFIPSGQQENASNSLKEYTELKKQFEQTYQRSPDKVDEDLGFIDTIPEGPLSEELKQELQDKFNIDSHEQLVELKQSLQVEKQASIQLEEHRQTVNQDHLKSVRALTDSHVRLEQELNELQNFKETLLNREAELKETAEDQGAKTELNQVIKDGKKLDQIIDKLNKTIQTEKEYLDRLENLQI